MSPCSEILNNLLGLKIQEYQHTKGDILDNFERKQKKMVIILQETQQ